VVHNSGSDHEKKLEYCCYFVDKEKKRLVVVWTNILPMASTRKKIYYFHDGVVYKIDIDNGVENYELINTWME